MLWKTRFLKMHIYIYIYAFPPLIFLKRVSNIKINELRLEKSILCNKLLWEKKKKLNKFK